MRESKSILLAFQSNGEPINPFKDLGIVLHPAKSGGDDMDAFSNRFVESVQADVGGQLTDVSSTMWHSICAK